MSKVVAALALLLQAVPATDLEIEEGEEPVFPKAFRGTWASSLQDCADEGSLTTVSISRKRIYGYESDSILLIITPINHHDTPAGADALTFTALMAERGEGEVDTGKVRISRVGDKLHMSRADAVSEIEHFTPRFANFRCPG